MIKPVKAEQIPQEQAIFNKAWAILKRYYNLTQTSRDEDWEAFLEEIHILSTMQVKGSLAKDIALAVVDHIETISKEV